MVTRWKREQMYFVTYDELKSYMLGLSKPPNGLVKQLWFCALCFRGKSGRDSKEAKDMRCGVKCATCHAICSTGYGLWEQTWLSEAEESGRVFDNQNLVARLRITVEGGNLETQYVEGSGRPCTLIAGCSGRMIARIKRVGHPVTGTQFLWWNCEVCKRDVSYANTKAKRDPRIEQARTESALEDNLARWAASTSVYVPDDGPLDPDLQDMQDRLAFLTGGE